MAFYFQKSYRPDIEQLLRQYYQSLSEKDRRRFAALEAIQLGHGRTEPRQRITLDLQLGQRPVDTLRIERPDPILDDREVVLGPFRQIRPPRTKATDQPALTATQPCDRRISVSQPFDDGVQECAEQ